MKTPDKPIPAAKPPPLSPKLLLVDDDDIDRMACRRALKRAGWRAVVREEATLEAAMAALREERFDCVLIDRGLPDGDGIDLLGTADPTLNVPAVVVITGRDTGDSGIAAIQRGAEDYVQKDRIDDLLPRAIRYAIERKRLKDDLHNANEKLRQLSEHDQLTGLLNRRGLDTRLNLERHRAKREASGLIGMLVDIDLFKRVNDTYGHAVGDQVIRHIAKQLNLACRATDHVARVGGDEFAVVLPGTTLSEARNIGERVRMLVNGSAVQHEGQSVPATVSIGIGVLGSDTLDTTALLRTTRFALSHSKKRGRDRVSLGNTVATSNRRHRRPELTISQVQRQVAKKALSVTRVPILDFQTREPVACEYLLNATNSGDVHTDAMLAVALNEGRLVELDLDYLDARLTVATGSDAALPCYVSVFPETLLSRHFDDMFSLLLGASVDKEIRVGLNTSLMPMDVGSLLPRVEKMRSAGIAIELLDITESGSVLDYLTQIRPQFARLSADLISDMRVSSRLRQVRRLVDLLGAFDATVIADGVHLEDDFSALLGIGVRYGTTQDPRQLGSGSF